MIHRAVGDDRACAALCLLACRSYRSSVTAYRLELFLLDEALAFFDGQDFIDARARDLIHDAARPADFDQINLRPLLQAEVQAHVVLRNVAAAAAHFVYLRQVAGDNFDLRADAVAVALLADGADQYRV